MNYYLLILNISAYQGPDYILGIFSNKSSAEQMALEQPQGQHDADNAQVPAVEVQTISSDLPLGPIAFVVSKYVEGFGQTMRESLHLFSDKDTAHLNMKKWQLASESDPDLSFPEYFLVEQIPLNQQRKFNEQTWYAGDYGEYV